MVSGSTPIIAAQLNVVTSCSAASAARSTAALSTPASVTARIRSRAVVKREMVMVHGTPGWDPQPIPNLRENQPRSRDFEGVRRARPWRHDRIHTFPLSDFE